MRWFCLPIVPFQYAGMHVSYAALQQASGHANRNRTSSSRPSCNTCRLQYSNYKRYGCATSCCMSLSSLAHIGRSFHKCHHEAHHDD